MKLDRLFPALLLAALALAISSCGSGPKMPESVVIEISGPPEGVVIFSYEGFTFSSSGNSKSISSAVDYGPLTLGADGKHVVEFDDGIDGLRFRVVAIDDVPLTLTATPAGGEVSIQEIKGQFEHATVKFGRTFNEEPGHPLHDSPDSTIYQAKNYIKTLEESQSTEG